jgi:hypothetical protein
LCHDFTSLVVRFDQHDQFVDRMALNLLDFITEFVHNQRYYCLSALCHLRVLGQLDQAVKRHDAVVVELVMRHRLQNLRQEVSKNFTQAVLKVTLQKFLLRARLTLGKDHRVLREHMKSRQLRQLVLHEQVLDGENCALRCLAVRLFGQGKQMH